MRKLLFSIPIGISLVFAASLIAWVAMPEKVAKALLYLNNASAGLSQKVKSTDIGDIHYLEGGRGEKIVLVHGIYARKEHWTDLARSLTRDYHVIALDLPGFGDNKALSDDQYFLSQQQENLLAVFDALGIENAHVAANSMGAYIAALLANSNPDRISSLAFIGSPLGVPTPVKVTWDLALKNGIKPLLVSSKADFHARMAWLSPNPPYVPGPILTSWMKSEVEMMEKNARIWDIVHNRSKLPTVLDLAPKLTMDTLIVWCNSDRIFHISGAAELAKSLKKSKLSVLDGCGHVPMLDRPDGVAGLYIEFLRSIDARTSN